MEELAAAAISLKVKRGDIITFCLRKQAQKMKGLAQRHAKFMVEP